jgi:glycosyltransferase involved in cell wall biosynthesis
VHHPFPLGFATVRAARGLGIPVVAVNHTIPECSLYGMRDVRGLYPFAVGAFRRYLIWFLQQASAICTPTETAARLLRGMPVRRPVEVISNGIDTLRFTPTADPRAARAMLGLPEKPIVLYTGRLDDEKDMPTWIRAAAMALKEVDAHLVIGGQGTARPALERLARDLGIEQHVTFPGYYPVAQLPRLYQSASVYCITSAVELQSISTLEALASGLPVVAAQARALPELVEDGVNGYLARPGDPQAFAAALVRLVRAPELGQCMGAAGRRRAEEHSLGVVARRHEQLLLRVAESHPPLRRAGGPARASSPNALVSAALSRMQS